MAKLRKKWQLRYQGTRMTDYGSGRGFVVLGVDGEGQPLDTATEVYPSLDEADEARDEMEAEVGEYGRTASWRVYGLVEVDRR